MVTLATPSTDYSPTVDAHTNDTRGLLSRAMSSNKQTCRKHRQATTESATSKLDSMIHEKHSLSLIPSRTLYITVAIALLGAFQFGWLMSELNYKQFHAKDPKTGKNLCDNQAFLKRYTDMCIMFPPHSQKEWTMTTSSWIAGGGIGAIFSGLPADVIGRKRGLAVTALIMIAGAAVQASAGSIYTMAAGRFVSGIASGASSNIGNILISEITPSTMRGFFLTGLQFAISFGSLMVTTVHYAMNSSAYTWRLLVGAPALIGILQLALLPYMANSPVWLINKGRIDEARDELLRLYRPHNTEAILRAMIASHEEEKKDLEGNREWRLLFSPKYRKQLLIACVLCAMQQLSGINAIMYYSNAIFSRVGIHDPRYANTIVNFARVHDIITASKLLDKYNRRTLLIIGMSVMALAGGGLVASLCYSSYEVTHYMAVVSMVFFVGCYCISIGPMSWIISNEIFPDFLNARAGACGTFFTWVCNFLVGVFFQQMADPENMGNYAFLTFTGCLVLGVIFVYFVVPETNHKSYYEIQKAFGIDEPLPPSILQDDDIWDDEEIAIRSSYAESVTK
ncbi:unnamed protein product [Aphanomyces euteiches]|uniref:Hexose transporter 1 n=1 Tax=Aphanomyces euteiches TaxID=100861 RepID=A0A6G0XYG8_9STRA|nr:hypothetical protein Ae201684_000083 [Aphanomyces euteiches]KAH9091512.1 hypothetical protein Ae201684P_011057 [Aphanomyces euteiches]KAH9146260.1 hypothetical protein AeRB84_009847 [Aphanomyces euteiches]